MINQKQKNFKSLISNKFVLFLKVFIKIVSYKSTKSYNRSKIIIKSDVWNKMLLSRFQKTEFTLSSYIKSKI